jgi:hypothetical protein
MPSLKQKLLLGVALGVFFGAWNVLAAWVAPLADDTLSAVLAFYGPMFLTWVVAGFAAGRRSGRAADGGLTGAVVALATFTVLTAIVIGRMNLSLEATSARPDWRNLMSRYPSSGFSSLRAYANYVYITGAPFKLFVATSIGALCGAIGGGIGSIVRSTRE